MIIIIFNLISQYFPQNIQHWSYVFVHCSRFIWHKDCGLDFWWRREWDQQLTLPICSSSKKTAQCHNANRYIQGCGSGSGGSGPFSVETEVRKFYRFRFHIGYLTWRVIWRNVFVHLPMWIKASILKIPLGHLIFKYKYYPMFHSKARLPWEKRAECYRPIFFQIFWCKPMFFILLEKMWKPSYLIIVTPEKVNHEVTLFLTFYMQLCNIRKFEVVIVNNTALVIVNTNRMSKNGFHLLVSFVLIKNSKFISNANFSTNFFKISKHDSKKLWTGDLWQKEINVKKFFVFYRFIYCKTKYVFAIIEKPSTHLWHIYHHTSFVFHETHIINSAIMLGHAWMLCERTLQ